MKSFDDNYVLLEDMYCDDYFPSSIVDKVSKLIVPVINYLEQGKREKEDVQGKLDDMTIGINDLQEQFEAHGIEIETGARESIGDTVEYILQYFEIDIDIETALQERDW